MSNDNVTVLHDVAKLPPPVFAPEFTVQQTTGYACTDDGQMSVVRFVTDTGMELRLIVPTLQIEAVVGALRAVKMMAASKMNVEGGATAVFTPGKYETITTPNYDGVLLAFDRGLATELIVGLDPEAAFSLGQHLRKQSKAASKLIIPDREIHQP